MNPVFVNSIEIHADGDEEMAEESVSNESDDSEDESETEMDDAKPPTKDELISAINCLKDVTLNSVTCFELLNSPLLVIEANNKRITFPIDNISHSIEMKVDEFKILNPSWVAYLDNYVMPQIKFKMVYNFDVIIELKKFSLIQSESIDTLCAVDQDEYTFATLIIQLPCKYKGGGHDIKHNDCLRDRFDLSITSHSRFEFSSFAIVYHRDHKHEMLPITEGAGAFLVYNLKAKRSEFIPKERSHEDDSNDQILSHLLRQWSWDVNSGKLVIGLSNEYTKQNLSFQNLKSTDLAVATLLKQHSSYSNFEIFVGFLKRTYHGEVADEDTKFDTRYESDILQTDYNIECLKCLDGNEFVQFQHFDVNLAKEVYPENCFDGVPFYRCQRDRFYNAEGSGFLMQMYDEDNLGFHVAKYYRVPVIVLFQRHNFINELKNCHTEVADIYKIFIALYQQYYETKPIQTFDCGSIEAFERFELRSTFRNYAHTVSCMPLTQKNAIQLKPLTISLIKVFIRIGNELSCSDVSTIKNYFTNNPTLTDEIVSLLIGLCDKHDWLPFAETLCNMFKQTKKFTVARKHFQLFHDCGVSSGETSGGTNTASNVDTNAASNGVTNVASNGVTNAASNSVTNPASNVVTNAALDGATNAASNSSTSDELTESSIQSNKKTVLQSIFNTILDNETKKPHTDESKFLASVWSWAKKTGMDIREFSKSQKVYNVVPFLIQLAERDAEIKSDDTWCEIADHFLNKMTVFLANKPVTNWRQLNVKISGNCDCLKNLTKFLNDDVQSATFNLHKIHRNHIQKAIEMLSVICTTDAEPGKSDIVVRKTRQRDQLKVIAYERILRLFNQLNSIRPIT